MNPITLFLAGAGLSMLLSWILVHVLRKSLVDLLEELWASRSRAGFWAAVGCVIILLLGTFGGTTNGGYSRAGEFTSERGFFALVTQLRSSLLGLFGALMVVSMTVMIFMGRVDRARGSAEQRQMAKAFDDFDRSKH